MINGGGGLVVVWWLFNVFTLVHSFGHFFVHSFCSLVCSLFCSLSLLPLPSPSSPSLSLSFAVGAVMQCGRLVSTISAEPLLAAGIQMMCEIDRCRELNKMINASLFESPDALKSFSTCWYCMLVVVLPVISGVESVFLCEIRQSLCQKRPNNTFQKNIVKNISFENSVNTTNESDVIHVHCRYCPVDDESVPCIAKHHSCHVCVDRERPKKRARMEKSETILFPRRL